jgi:predicted peptidase
MKRLLIVLMLAACPAILLAVNEPYTIHPIGSTEAPYGYLEHLPDDFGKAKAKYPLVFFLHGLGELGDSNKDLPKVAGAGPLKLIAAHDPLAAIFVQQSAVVIAPQGLRDDKWWKTEKLLATLAFIIKTRQIDLDRIYITGLSMGGGGTWNIATSIPEQLAAIAPICGAAGPGNADAAKLHGLPIWANHAFNDGTVKFADTTKRWFDNILTDLKVSPDGGAMTGYMHTDKPWTGWLAKQGWQWQEGNMPANIPAKQLTLVLTVYPDNSHDSWSRTYQNPGLWAWMFAQSRAKTVDKKK